ncbi:hypothetical protein GQ55_8G167600 [Panicum hallii var. hallii]|uniref:Uncharacterized protein n=1 Tax=Panicum hallii var. hallii TaxID=1504633 RepID=A0A2T7CNH2_9POAL|nr:hypothetical protein GQ55_8G167600 [Panicum hallii var. hallii]
MLHSYFLDVAVCIYVVLQGMIFIYCMKNEVHELINGMVTRTNKSRVKRMFTEGPVSTSSRIKEIKLPRQENKLFIYETLYKCSRTAKSAYKMLHQGSIPLHSHKLISGGPGHL